MFMCITCFSTEECGKCLCVLPVSGVRSVASALPSKPHTSLTLWFTPESATSCVRNVARRSFDAPTTLTISNTTLACHTFSAMSAPWHFIDKVRHNGPGIHSFCSFVSLY